MSRHYDVEGATLGRCDPRIFCGVYVRKCARAAQESRAKSGSASPSGGCPHSRHWPAGTRHLQPDSAHLIFDRNEARRFLAGILCFRRQAIDSAPIPVHRAYYSVGESHRAPDTGAMLSRLTHEVKVKSSLTVRNSAGASTIGILRRSSPVRDETRGY
jgi:hypothetical protein